MKKLLSSFVALLALALAAFSMPAAAVTTGYITFLEVHVGTAQIRFRVNNGSNQYLCGTIIEGYFPLTAGTVVGSYTYTQGVIDALAAASRQGRGQPIEADVYAVSNGAGACNVTDIVLK